MPDDSQERYVVKRPLGEGGFGQVLLAYDTKVKRHVAIKRLLDALENSPKQEAEIARLGSEVRRVGELSHETICKIFDLIRWQNSWAMVMEYIPGITMRDWLAENAGALTATLLKRRLMLHRLAEGLAYVQGRLIHRDLKPDNILLKYGSPCQPVILDFGVSLSREELSGNKTHGMGGTTRYMAPEQYTRQTIDYRVDIYSFGVIAHEVLTHTIRKTIGKDRNRRALPLDYDLDAFRDLDPWLQELIQAMTHDEPEHRPSWQDILDIMHPDHGAWQRMGLPWPRDRLRTTWEVRLSGGKKEIVQFYSRQAWFAGKNWGLEQWMKQLGRISVVNLDNRLELRQKYGHVGMVVANRRDETLDDWLVRHPNHPSQTADIRWRIFQQLSQMLAAIHRQGVCLGGMEAHCIHLGQGLDGPHIYLTCQLPGRPFLDFIPDNQQQAIHGWQIRDIHHLAILGYRILTGENLPEEWQVLPRQTGPTDARQAQNKILWDDGQHHAPSRINYRLPVGLDTLFLAMLQCEEPRTVAYVGELQALSLVNRERGVICRPSRVKIEHFPLIQEGGYAFGMGDQCSLPNTTRRVVVQLSRFRISPHLVTRGEYREYLQAHDMPMKDPLWSYPELDAHPVVDVTWEEAKAFAMWAGGDLPSEAQWEVVAKSAVTGRDFPTYPWGEEPPDYYRANIGHQWPATTPVGSFPPSKLGVYDLTGNVWEWCLDWWHPDWPRQMSSMRNPVQDIKNLALPHRVVRGGAFNSFIRDGQCAWRHHLPHNQKYPNVGFRLVYSA